MIEAEPVAQPSRQEILYTILAVLFSLIVVLSSLLSVKFFSFPLFTYLVVPVGLITYPLTLFINSSVTEFYGESRARFLVYLGLSMVLVTLAMINLAKVLSPHPDWTMIYNQYGYPDNPFYQAAISSIFGFNIIALLSSMAAFVVSQLLEIRLFGFMKELTRSKHLWARLFVATSTSQIIDTLIMNILLLYCGLKLELNTVIQVCLACYLYKLCFAVFSIPFLYLFNYFFETRIKQKQESSSEAHLIGQLAPKMG